MPEVRRFRQRVKTATLTMLMHFMDNGTQKLAFGHNLLQLLIYAEFAALDNVKRLKKAAKLLQEFLENQIKF